MDNRTSKENYYLDIADAVLQRSTCLRRMYGAIIGKAYYTGAIRISDAVALAAACQGDGGAGSLQK